MSPPRRRLVALGFAALVAAALGVLAGCTVQAANAAPLPTVERLVATDADSSVGIVYRITWPAVSDANGAATSYLDTVTLAGAVVHTHSGPGLADTVTVPKPTAGSALALQACVRAVRRGLVSAPGCVSWTASMPDVPPPAPAPTIDSSQTLGMSRLVPDSVTLAPGDSALITVERTSRTGQPLPYVQMNWFIPEATRAIVGDSGLVWHPLSANAAWIVVSPTIHDPTTGLIPRRVHLELGHYASIGTRPAYASR